MIRVSARGLDPPELPMTAAEAIQHFTLTEFEVQEIVKYDKQIYYVGQNCKTKVKGHPIKMV
jgi:hypothetical protein